MGGRRAVKSSRFWIGIVAALLLVSLAGALLLNRNSGGRAAVYQDGELLRVIDLSRVDEPYTFVVDSPQGSNTVEVERGRVRVSHADCPDQVCVRQGWLTGAAPIVCLPHKLVIQFVGDADGLDGVSG